MDFILSIMCDLDSALSHSVVSSMNCSALMKNEGVNERASFYHHLIYNTPPCETNALREKIRHVVKFKGAVKRGMEIEKRKTDRPPTMSVMIAVLTVFDTTALQRRDQRRTDAQHTHRQHTQR